MTEITCLWCIDDNADDAGPDDHLCDVHRAEFLGVTVDWLERSEAGREAEYQDTLG